MKLKDVIIAVAIAAALFPVVLCLTMYATGFMQVNFGWKKQETAKPAVEVIKYTPYQESLMVVHSKSFQALEAQRIELNRKEKKVIEDQVRLQEIEREVTRRNEELEKTRKRLEELVGKSAELEDRRIKQLAGIYGAMRAEEAAPILFTLRDDLIVRILLGISDNRAKAKLLSAMGNLSKERTGKISKLLGGVKK